MKTGLLLVMVIIFSDPVISAKLAVEVHHNKTLPNCGYRKISGATMNQCLAACLADCRCLLFQMCAQECLFCSTHTADLTGSNECNVYRYVIEDLNQVDNAQCEHSCSSVINCCHTSNPCEDGRTCVPSSSPSDHKRFTCECKDGYHGTNCEKHMESCRSYRDAGTLTPGNYPVLDDDNKPFQVYCDFDTNSNMAWTLVQSYEFAKRNDEPYKFTFQYDSPRNQDAPSWKDYRLSKSRMKHMRQRNSKWRITCNYEKDGLTDYVRGANKYYNIINFAHETNGRCQAVEYIDIHGSRCVDCNVTILQHKNEAKNLPFNIFVNDIPDEACQWPTAGEEVTWTFDTSCNTGKKSYFGWYKCPDPNHRCSSSLNATTQLWFGGN